MAATMTNNSVPGHNAVYYPDGDGKPMAESDEHWDVGVYCVEALKEWYKARNDVYVAGNNFIYFIQHRPLAFVSPDCYVVFGVDSRQRKSYKAWEEDGLLPNVVIEITSASTRSEDSERKLALYQDMLAVPEYFLFDPTGDYLDPRLKGYRLTDNKYTVLPQEADGSLHSEQLGLNLRGEGDRLRLFDPIAGRVLLTRREYEEFAEAQAQARNAEAERANQEATRADSEAKARTEAEAKLAQALAELEALRKQSGV